MVTILTRAQCGLALPIPTRLQVRTAAPVVGITFHVTVTQTSDPVAKWRQIQAAAMGGSLPSGDIYGDLPYHDGITLDGRILQGRGHRYVGAHATSTHNVANIATDGVAVIGDGRTLTDAAKQAIRAYVYLWTLEHGHRPQYFDHLDWRALGGIATACPDPPIVRFVEILRQEARAGH